MRKMLMALWLSIFLVNAEKPTLGVKGCGVKGSQSTSVFIEHNTTVGVYISPNHFLITHKRLNFNKAECENGDFTEQFEKFTKVKFVGRCEDTSLMTHGFFVVEDANTTVDFFACLPTERVAENTNLEIQMLSDPPKPVTVLPSTDKDLRKIFLSPAEETLKVNGNPVLEKKQDDHYTVHGMGMWNDERKNGNGEMASVFYHLKTICKEIGLCEPLTTDAPSTAAPTTEDPTSTTVSDVFIPPNASSTESTESSESPSSPDPAETSESTETSEPATESSPSVSVTSEVQNTSEASTEASSEASSEVSTESPTVTIPQNRTSRKPFTKAPKIQKPNEKTSNFSVPSLEETIKMTEEECGKELLCFDEDLFDSAGSLSVLIALIVLILVVFD